LGIQYSIEKGLLAIEKAKGIQFMVIAGTKLKKKKLE